METPPDLPSREEKGKGEGRGGKKETPPEKGSMTVHRTLNRAKPFTPQGEEKGKGREEGTVSQTAQRTL